MPKVHSVDGDVMQYWETSINDHREDFTDYNEVHDNIVSGSEWQSAVYEDDVWEESNNNEDNVWEDKNNVEDNDDMDTAGASLQVSIPDFLDEDMIIQGEGGVIYVDYDDLVTAESTVVEDDELVEDVTDEEIEDVMEHNNKLVGIIKNTMEMQAFLFDKLLNYLF